MRQTCGSCFTPTRATETVRWSFGDQKYKAHLCAKHAADWHANMLRWARCGEPDEQVTYTSKLNPADLGPIIRSRVAFPVIKTGEVINLDGEPEEVVVAKPAPPKPRHDPTLPIGYEKWRMTQHALERAQQRGLDRKEILWAAQQPEIVREDLYREHVRTHIRGDVKVVVDLNLFQVMTVARENYTEERKQYARSR